MKPVHSPLSTGLSRFWWEIPVLVVLGICFLKGTSFIRPNPELIECRAELSDATDDVARLRRRQEDGSLLKGLTAASFQVTVKSSNDDILKMSPKSMALQIEQLREIVNKFNVANKRLLIEKKQLAQDKERTLDQLARRVVTSSADATDSAACESNLRATELQASTLKDDLERAKAEHMTMAVKLDESAAQAKQSDSTVEEMQSTVLELKAKLEQARVRIGRLAQGTMQPRFFAATAAQELQGYKCQATTKEMEQYLKYKQGQLCPEDWFFVQHLIFDKNCFALPPRKCRTRTPATRAEPLPLPQSLFDQRALNDKTVRWGLHKCKSFGCLAAQGQGGFNLTQEEASRKLPPKGVIPMEKVVALKKGGLRIGLDIGGGTGSFAAHMANHGVTVVTTAVNRMDGAQMNTLGTPNLEAMAARGVFPLHLPTSSRLPLYDGTLDLVHGASQPLPSQWEGLLFELDRVLRVGGILWLESVCVPSSKLPQIVAPLERLGYKKLHWNKAPTAPSRDARGQMLCLNCVLEKQPVAALQRSTKNSTAETHKRVSAM